MLTVGIVFMVASVVVGVIVLTSVALMSSPGRAATGALTQAMAPSDRRPDAPYYPAGQNVRYHPGQQDAAAYAAEAEDPPGWLLKLAMASAAGLLLGLLISMIGAML